MRTQDDALKPAASTEASPVPAPAPEQLDEKAFKERTDKEIAERLSSPPDAPTPSQAEADALKERR